MLASKRKFTRHAVPLGVKFRPTYGAREYARGAVKNLSCGGIGLDAHDFRFIVYENLELIVETPGKEGTVALSGDVLWKKQDGRRCEAGIKFRMKDEQLQEEAIRKIFDLSNMSVDNMYDVDSDYIMPDKNGGIHAYEMTRPDSKFLQLPNKLGFIKQYSGDGSRCTVTFRLLKEMAEHALNVTIVGDFNNWDVSQSPMTRLESGDFVITLELDSKRRYRFRYLIDGNRWENDWYADRFVSNGRGSKDSVVIV